MAEAWRSQSFGLALLQLLSLKSFAVLHDCCTAVIGPPFTWLSRAKRRSSCLQVKGSTLISQFFKIPSTVPVPRIGPRTSRSAIKRSTDRANPAAVDYYVQHGRSTGPELNWTGSLAPYFKSLCAFGKLLCDSVNLREILIIFQLNAIDKGKSKGTLNLIALELLKILRILKRKKLKIIFDNF